MTQADWTQQILRIGLYILSPLLAKWGFDEGSTTALITGLAGTVGALTWWYFWNRKK